MTEQIYIGLAAYNESRNLPILLERLRKISPQQIIIYDDGSEDDTYDYLTTQLPKHPIHLLHEPINKGLGYAIGQIIKFACNTTPEDAVLILMDADNTHDPSTIIDMLKHINNGYDVVIASRYENGAKVKGVSLFRILLSHACSTLWHLKMPIHGVKDYSSGYRAYRISTLKKALSKYGEDSFVTRNGFECQLEILAKLKGIASFTEAPINLEYDRKASPSSMKIMKAILGHLTLAAKLRNIK